MFYFNNYTGKLDVQNVISSIIFNTDRANCVFKTAKSEM